MILASKTSENVTYGLQREILSQKYDIGDFELLPWKHSSS